MTSKTETALFYFVLGFDIAAILLFAILFL
jgi:hypothetical protein